LGLQQKLWTRLSIVEKSHGRHFSPYPSLTAPTCGNFAHLPSSFPLSPCCCLTLSLALAYGRVPHRAGLGRHVQKESDSLTKTTALSLIYSIYGCSGGSPGLANVASESTKDNEDERRVTKSVLVFTLSFLLTRSKHHRHFFVPQRDRCSGK
jgi:hypothetical protein